MMATTALRNVTGSHLTATDRRNVAAVLDSPGFELNRPYRVNGRKVYRIDRDGDRWAVSVTETEVDGYGRRIDRTYRSQFSR